VAIRFDLGLGRGDDEHFRWSVVVFKNHREQRRGELYRLRLGNFKGTDNGQSKACVITYKLRKKNQWLGYALFSEEYLRDDTLLHESVHMAWSMADYLRRYNNEYRGYKRDYEEMLCMSAGVIFRGLKQAIRRELRKRRRNKSSK
jgi:hypothetical protein